MKILLLVLALSAGLFAAYPYDDYTDTYDNYTDTYDDYKTHENDAPVTETGAAAKEHAALLEEYMQKLSAYEYGSEDYKKKVQSIKIDLILRGTTSSIEEISSANGLWIEFNDGNEGILSGLPLGTKSASIPLITNNKTKNFTRASELKIGSDKVLLIAAEYWSWGENDDIPLIASELKSAGFDVTYKTYNHQLSGNIADFKNWDDYGLVLISSHGFASKTRSAIDLNIPLPTYIPKWMEKDINAKKLVLWQNNGKTSLLASNKFFEYYHNDLPNTFVYMSACSVGKNPAMANALMKNNASSWVGYSDVVKVNFTIENGVSLFKKLLQPGHTLKNSFQYGVKEDDSDPAEMVLFAAHDVVIVDSNGEGINLEDELINSLNGKSLNTNGHFIHYGKDKFDWIYVDIKTYGVFKLEGMNENGSMRWSVVDINSFTNISMDNDSGEIVFGKSSHTEGLESLLSLRRFKPNGHFIHYGEEMYDWLYVNSTGSFVAKLEGMKEDGSLKWLMIDISKFTGLTIYQNGNIIAF
jgi:hypothetical protein